MKIDMVKMEKLSFCILGAILMLLVSVECNPRGNIEENTVEHNELEHRQIDRAKGWTDTAKDLLAGPAGQFAVHMAKEVMSRTAGNSQILSLNLTNLFILLLLKALIFAAGLIGAGNWSQYARGRSIDGCKYKNVFRVINIYWVYPYYLLI